MYREEVSRETSDFNHTGDFLPQGDERYRSLIGMLPIGIIVHSDWKIVMANPTALAIAGVESSNDFIGRSLLEFIHPDSLAAVLEHVALVAVEGRNSDSTDITLVRTDGSTSPVNVTSGAVMRGGRIFVQSAIQGISGSKQIDDKLRLQDAALNAVGSAIVITDRTGKVEWANPAFERLTGYNPIQTVGTDIGELLKSGKQSGEFYEDMWRSILSGRVWHGQMVNRRRDGTTYDEKMTITPVCDRSGEVTHFIAVKEDISEKRFLEEELSQVQKMDAIGRLAGGVAHDYNNILGVILGYGELIRSKIPDGDVVGRQLDALIAAAKRGADLTRQLLSFARREAHSPKVLNVNSAIHSIEGMLRQLVGENRSLVIEAGKDLWNTNIDPTQLDQVLVNLTTNARDAIEDVGTIVMRTENVRAEDAPPSVRGGLTSEEYVRISVADTGKGMDTQTIKEIFEPFFTTKSRGHGTGLGLSMVYGIVTQNGGRIDVRSESGVGTSFHVYLPRSKGETEKVSEAEPDRAPNGNATVLIVEDQSDLLDSAKNALEDYGYKVLGALTPGDALSLSETYPGRIDLILVDVIMPTMNGGDLSRKIAARRPEIKTLFMSGYGEDVLAIRHVVGNGTPFIQKPFTPRALAKKIQEVLGKS